MISHNVNYNEGQCIIGEEVINLLTGKRYKFEEDHSQIAHWPIRLMNDRRKLLLL